uniref:Uncharacterized protein n=1 Tax=Arundo donax TaxID=35708 RepID=A0A0A9DY51_ARUDO
MNAQLRQGAPHNVDTHKNQPQIFSPSILSLTKFVHSSKLYIPQNILSTMSIHGGGTNYRPKESFLTLTLR